MLRAVVMTAVGLTSLGAVFAWSPGQAARFLPLEQAPEAFRAPAARALEAFDQVQGALAKRLMTEMQAGGPVHAIDVCRQEAQAITKRVAGEQGFAVGRTSHRVRNPDNQPRSWMAPLVERAARSAAPSHPQVVDLGDKVGVARPIMTADLCVRCHGRPERLTPELTSALARLYPADQAVGFETGQVRGFFWAEVPKEK